jgi:pilus assembly protein CpaC
VKTTVAGALPTKGRAVAAALGLAVWPCLIAAGAIVPGGWRAAEADEAGWIGTLDPLPPAEVSSAGVAESTEPTGLVGAGAARANRRSGGFDPLPLAQAGSASRDAPAQPLPQAADVAEGEDAADGPRWVWNGTQGRLAGGAEAPSSSAPQGAMGEVETQSPSQAEATRSSDLPIALRDLPPLADLPPASSESGGESAGESAGGTAARTGVSRAQAPVMADPGVPRQPQQPAMDLAARPDSQGGVTTAVPTQQNPMPIIRDDRAGQATQPTPVSVPPTLRPTPNERASVPQAQPIEELSRGVYRQGNTITATVGRAVHLDLEKPVSSVVIGNRGIVSEILAEPKRVFLVGNTVGSTNVFFRDEQGNVFESYEMTVKADVDGLHQALAAVLPENRVRVTPTQSGVVLSGQVRSAVDAANAADVAKQFVGGQGSVVNSLNIAGDQQVLLRVRVAEMNRTARKFLATDTGFEAGGDDQKFRSYPYFNRSPQSSETVTKNYPWYQDGFIGYEFDPTSPFVFGNNQGDLTQLFYGAAAAATGPTGSLVIGALGIGDITFSTLEEKSLVRILSEPTLTAISGETADFLVGGEFPVPSGIDDTGNPIITFKPFGVSLQFTPVVLSDNLISLAIRTEVSRRSDENAIPVGATSVPGISTRRAESTVMLPSGGSLMIAGLLQSEDRNGLQGVPGLMDLPVLGALFRSTDFQNDRSELVVTVEAYKVRAHHFGEDLALPTDGFPPADDMDIYLFGRLHDRYGSGEPLPSVAVAAPYGFMME